MEQSFISHNIQVDFPHHLYEPQKAFIEHLIKALVSGKNAMLESPTGEEQQIHY